ncbi:MAG: hypothetical protein A3C61_01610 [Candidatus Yanofskybacteria bacterium RIFCSPHIGHO2_02_FULL_39_10]|uniref:Ada DNA repair metal-binding domain-containing protein n=1 Tax=Candidatus Yanofskybacteria bacterium RIFCSPHIGHO2_02_FULL_39_10 TaxID=1802674 RepID=A0A1F8FAJ2_9BACT|nr:MAG: hypothetical protein A3C61_01610 [Candidatus Yanofskybacteria bacterium RIFCSPHIGHO2_02_FULL_39_10]
MIAKLLNIIKSSQYHLFLALCIGLISFVSYNLGKIDALDKRPIKIGENSGWKVENSNLKADIFEASNNATSTTLNSSKQLDTRVVTSKNSDKYHYTWCAGAKRIKEENKVWFNSSQEAEGRGYTLAGNCEK